MELGHNGNMKGGDKDWPGYSKRGKNRFSKGSKKRWEDIWKGLTKSDRRKESPASLRRKKENLPKGKGKQTFRDLGTIRERKGVSP